MKATITKRGGYRCAPTGSVVEVFPEGATVEGWVAGKAVEDDAANPTMPPKKPKPAKKAIDGAPENK